MSRTPETTEQIERELAALDEAPPSAAELAWLERESDEDPDIATVARLTELAHSTDRTEEVPSLSDLELQQVWRKLEQRGQTERAHAPTSSHVKGSGSSPRRWWLLAAAGLAAAAAVVIIVVPQEPEPSAAEIAEIGEQVRASLEVFDDGKSDSERADELAAAYQRRLAGQQERGG